MARVASTSSAVGLPSFRPSAPQSHHQPPRFVNFSFHFQKKNLAHHSLSCRNASNPVDSASKEENPLSEPDSDVNGTAVNAAAGTTETSSFVGGVFPEYPDKTVKRRVALVSTVAGVGFFLSARLNFGGVSLKDLSADALPYEEALSNGKPTVVEFYADWCGICRELAPDVYKAEQQYKDRVNFVMLNVDNTKWKQELDEFGVKGIPHFSFLDKDGNEEGNVVGRLPTQYLLENVDALARGKATVPHARVVEQYSRAQSRKVRSVVDPRSHE